MVPSAMRLLLSGLALCQSGAAALRKRSRVLLPRNELSGNESLGSTWHEESLENLTAESGHMARLVEESLEQAFDAATRSTEALWGDSVAVGLASRAHSPPCPSEKGTSQARFGCRDGCECYWFEHCYPAHRTRPEHLKRGADSAEVGNVGVCGMNIAMMIVASVAIFVAALLCVLTALSIRPRPLELSAPPTEVKVMSKKASKLASPPVVLLPTTSAPAT